MEFKCEDCDAAFEWNLMKEAQREKLGQPTTWAQNKAGEQEYKTSKKEEQLIKLKNTQKQLVDELNDNGGLVNRKLENAIKNDYEQNKKEIHDKEEEIDDRLNNGEFA